MEGGKASGGAEGRASPTVVGVFVVAAVIATAATCIAVRGRRPSAPPSPSARIAGQVRVVATGSDDGRKPFAAARPSSGASAAVDVVCGLDSRTAGRYASRIGAFRSIAGRRDLPPEDVSVLLGYVASTNDAMSAELVAGLKNEVLNLLRNQDPVPERLAGLMMDMVDSGDYDATTVDYCTQHLGAMWRDFATEGMRERARNVFVSAASCKGRPYAGTALYSLADEKDAPAEYREKLRRLTVAIACDPAANRLARISAMQLAARKGYAEVLKSARKTIAEPRPDAVLAMVSVGAIGSLGCAADIPALECLRESGGRRLEPAIDAALAKLGGGKMRFQQEKQRKGL